MDCRQDYLCRHVKHFSCSVARRSAGSRKVFYLSVTCRALGTAFQQHIGFALRVHVKISDTGEPLRSSRKPAVQADSDPHPDDRCRQCKGPRGIPVAGRSDDDDDRRALDKRRFRGLSNQAARTRPDAAREHSLGPLPKCQPGCRE